MRQLPLLLLLLSSTAALNGQQIVDLEAESIRGQGVSALAVVNAASFVLPELPNGSIAQGSMFNGFGSGLGPAQIAFPNPWPFPVELAGKRVQVQVGGPVVDCFLVFTSSGQIAAILPSNTPLGEGTITVFFNGAVAATGPITVVAHSFGIFTINHQPARPRARRGD